MIFKILLTYITKDIWERSVSDRHVTLCDQSRILFRVYLLFANQGEEFFCD